MKMGVLSSLVKFGAKGFIAWVAVDYTIREGFWSSSSDSIKAFNTLMSRIQRIVPNSITNQIPKMPTLPGKECIRKGWNEQVINATEYSLEAPTKISNLIENNLFQNDELNPNVKESVQ